MCVVEVRDAKCYQNGANQLTRVHRSIFCEIPSPTFVDSFLYSCALCDPRLGVFKKQLVIRNLTV